MLSLQPWTKAPAEWAANVPVSSLRLLFVIYAFAFCLGSLCNESGGRLGKIIPTVSISRFAGNKTRDSRA